MQSSSKSLPTRLHWVDAVRAFAMILGIVAHATISFWPGSGLDSRATPNSQTVFYVIHVFRMLTFFFIAGFFGRQLLERKGVRALLYDRSKKILIPLLVAWPVATALLVSLSLYVLAWKGSLPQEASPPVERPTGFPLGYLWFLYYLLFLYVLFVISWIVFRESNWFGSIAGKLGTFLHYTTKKNVLAVCLMGPVLLLFLINKPEIWRCGIPTPDRSLVPEPISFTVYSIAFFLGWLMEERPALLSNISNFWSTNLTVSVLTISLCLWTADSSCTGHPASAWTHSVWWRNAYGALYALAAWSSTLALLGIGIRFFSTEFVSIKFLAESSYWAYLAHLPIVVAFQIIVMRLELHWLIKLCFIVLGTLAAILLSYAFFVRSTFIGAYLNGPTKLGNKPPAFDV